MLMNAQVNWRIPCQRRWLGGRPAEGVGDNPGRESASPPKNLSPDSPALPRSSWTGWRTWLFYYNHQLLVLQMHSLHIYTSWQPSPGPSCSLSSPCATSPRSPEPAGKPDCDRISAQVCPRVWWKWKWLAYIWQTIEIIKKIHENLKNFYLSS